MLSYAALFVWLTDMRFLRCFLLFLGILLAASRGGAAFSILDWNVAGNGATDWSTNAPQVQALGRHMRHFNADILTFQEIPVRESGQMDAFVAAYLPGYHLAVSPGTDGYLCSAILSRYPIRRAQSWLDDADLQAFGHAGRFTRDLFEAEIEVPNFGQPVHVFTTHLKNGSDADSASRRGAEAGAISNFFVRVFRPAHPAAPYLLTGDLNEDVSRPGEHSRDTVPRLANDATGLELTRPLDPNTGSERTWSSRMAFLVVRYDYILPSADLYARLFRSQVFRAATLDTLPPPLKEGDAALASDHLPVLMIFRNPDNGPFTLSLRQANGSPPVLEWPAWPGYTYQVFRSHDLERWLLQDTLSPGGGNRLEWRAAESTPPSFWRLRRIP